MKLTWHEAAWDDYLWWQANNRKTVARINALLKDIERNGHHGMGKPEPLRHKFHGSWSRRIDTRHRLVYQIADDEILIISCRYHYRR